MPHTNRHQQRALPLKGGHPNPEAKAKLAAVRQRILREVEEKESVAEVRYWERRTWLYSR